MSPRAHIYQRQVLSPQHRYTARIGIPGTGHESCHPRPRYPGTSHVTLGIGIPGTGHVTLGTDISGTGHVAPGRGNPGTGYVSPLTGIQVTGHVTPGTDI